MLETVDSREPFRRTPTRRVGHRALMERLWCCSRRKACRASAWWCCSKLMERRRQAAASPISCTTDARATSVYAVTENLDESCARVQARRAA